MSKGSKITLKAEATGGSGTYTYKFAVLKCRKWKMVGIKRF